MIKFLKVTNAFNNKPMLIKLDMIATVEEDSKTRGFTEVPIRKITFVDNRPEEYATEELSYFEKFMV